MTRRDAKVADKLLALRTEDYFRERAGRGKPPVPGDELG